MTKESDSNRIAIAEIQLIYHKEMHERVLNKLDAIDKKIEDLTAFKMQLVGISVVIPIIISLSAIYFSH